MIDRSDKNDLIPSADELREEVIDKSILDKQTKGWKAIRTQLRNANKIGMHTLCLTDEQINKIAEYDKKKKAEDYKRKLKAEKARQEKQKKEIEKKEYEQYLRLKKKFEKE